MAGLAGVPVARFARLGAVDPWTIVEVVIMVLSLLFNFFRKQPRK
jgi:hypothetical protein